MISISRIKYKMKRFLIKRNLILKQKIYQWLGIKTLTNEVNANFIQINALEEYIKIDKGIKEFVKNQCIKYNITDPDIIKQIIKNQENKNYLDYNNKMLPEEMKEESKKINCSI